MNLYLVRHGESEGNKSQEMYFKMNDWEIPLTKEGVIQAQSAANTLGRIFRNHIPIITSTYVRAVQTTNIIASYFDYPTIIESVLIRERDWGSLREEIKQFETRKERNHLFEFYRRPLRGESFADVYQRAMVFLNFELPKYKMYNNIVIVSHGEFIKVLCMILDGYTVNDFNNIPNIKNCEIITKHFDV